jgi:hypothetical protein
MWQAGRNERLATQLLNQQDYNEWVVVATFYSALHYVEAAVTKLPGITHCETSIPKGFHGSVHDWREDLVRLYFTSAYTSYRKLRIQSMIARYLTTNYRSIADTPVEDYWSDEDIHNFIDHELNQIRTSLGFA